MLVCIFHTWPNNMSLRLSSSVVLIKDSPELRLPNFTIACWFKLNNVNISQTLVSKQINGPPWGSPFASYLMRINSSASVEFLQGDPISSGFQDWVATLPVALQTGSWYHMAWSGHQVTASWVMYLNGVQPVTDSLVRSQTLNFNAGPFIFGGDWSAAPFGDRMNGEISDVRIYNRRLSSEEMFKLYSSRGKFSSIVDGLVGYWPLDDGPVDTSSSASLIQDHQSINDGTGSSAAGGFGRFIGESLLSYSNTNGM